MNLIFYVNTFLCTYSSFTGNNGGRGGILSTSYLPLLFEGASKFTKNSGTSLTVSITQSAVGERFLVGNHVIDRREFAILIM